MQLVCEKRTARARTYCMSVVCMHTVHIKKELRVTKLRRLGFGGGAIEPSVRNPLEPPKG